MAKVNTLKHKNGRMKNTCLLKINIKLGWDRGLKLFFSSFCVSCLHIRARKCWKHCVPLERLRAISAKFGRLALTKIETKIDMPLLSSVIL